MNKTKLMNEFEEITDQILALDLNVENSIIIQQIEDLLDKREQIINKIDALESNEDTSTENLNRMMQKNVQVETLLLEVKMNVSSKLKEIHLEKSLSSKKKKANRGYLNPGHQNDGYFIDKKK